MPGPSRVITLFSTKGGVGKTVVAVNLALALQRRFRKVALWELERQGTEGDATRMLASTALRPLSGADRATFAQTLQRLRQAHEILLIDAGSRLTELSLLALNASNLILMVSTPDLIAIQHVTAMIERLESVQIPKRMVQVVLNRAGSWGNFGVEEVKSYLPVNVIEEIPSDGRTVSLSINRGIPCVVLAEKSRIGQAFKRLASALMSSPEVFVEHVPLIRADLPASLLDGQELPMLPPGGRGGEGAQGSEAGAADPVLALKRRIHARLVEELDVNLKRMDPRTLNDPQEANKLRQKVESTVLDLMAQEQGFLPNQEQRARFVKEMADEVLALGPLEDLIADPEVSDILVNGPERIYVETQGKLLLTDKRFLNNDQLLSVIERIIAPLGRRIDELTPLVDARLADGSRVNAVIPPLSLVGPVLSIRKFRRERMTVEDFIRLGTLEARMVELLRACVLARKNLIISGGTGSGKTTLLNLLSSFIPETERIVTIEDAAELRLAQRHWIPLEARLPNIESKGAITIRQLFRNTLRMRPDRILIGECRGDETLDMLQAMNTGHDGSMTTLHANSPQDVIARLDALVLMSNVELPARAVREQVASAIHLVIHTARLSDGSRKITHITELTGIDAQADVLFQDLFRFEQQGLDAQGKVLGRFAPTGAVPTALLEECRSKGIALDARLFQP